MAAHSKLRGMNQPHCIYQNQLQAAAGSGAQPDFGEQHPYQSHLNFCLRVTISLCTKYPCCSTVFYSYSCMGHLLQTATPNYQGISLRKGAQYV